MSRTRRLAVAYTRDRGTWRWAEWPTPTPLDARQHVDGHVAGPKLQPGRPRGPHPHQVLIRDRWTTSSTALSAPDGPSAALIVSRRVRYLIGLLPLRKASMYASTRGSLHTSWRRPAGKTRPGCRPGLSRIASHSPDDMSLRNRKPAVRSRSTSLARSAPATDAVHRPARVPAHRAWPGTPARPEWVNQQRDRPFARWATREDLLAGLLRGVAVASAIAAVVVIDA